MLVHMFFSSLLSLCLAVQYVSTYVLLLPLVIMSGIALCLITYFLILCLATMCDSIFLLDVIPGE